jgi:hypothetical protein
MVRCAPEDTERHLADGAAPMEMRGKELSGWLTVPVEAVADDEQLARWVRVGVARAQALPPK